MNEAEWEAHFRSVAGSSRQQTGPDPRVTELVEQFAPLGSARRALDLACGSGGNALWLAGQGWSVTAVDRSSAAIDLLQSDAARGALDVTTRIANLEAHEFTIEPGSWELILMCRYLQTDLFETARFGLAPGGLLIVITLLADPAIAGPQRFRAQPGELGSYFRNKPGWTIVHERDNVNSPDDFARRRATAELVVRRGAG